MNRISLAAAAVCSALLSPVAGARGVSPYLPLNLSPEIERQIERVLILADKPVMSRPIAAATVLDALPAACRIDPVLCGRVRGYLNRYMRKSGVDHASLEAAATDHAIHPAPNRYGMAADSAWQASAIAHWQPSDYAIVSVGGVAYEDEATPDGSMLSLGFDFAQLDVGYRPHWFSPFTDSSMLISTEAQTLPSITLSNYRPLTSLRFTYEVFVAKMEYSDEIAYKTTGTKGNPRLGGMRFGIEPADGWSVSANRLMQFGGGEREGSFTDFLRAAWQPNRYDNRSGNLGQDDEFGNQLASFTSRFIFPGATPFAAYVEYAGEDTSYEGNYRLGNAALSIGMHFPRLWQRFDLAVEVSEWQNAWYVSGIYHDGLTNRDRVLGHWGADHREFLRSEGAQSMMARLGWEPTFGGLMQVRARTIKNQNYYGRDYDRGYQLDLSYARTLSGFTAGGELTLGHDTFDDNFGRIAGFVRFGDEWASGGSSGDWGGGSERPNGANLFVDAGAAASQVTIRLGLGEGKRTTSTELSPHFGIGARRAVSGRSDLGVRAEIDRINDHMLLAVRAVDYRYRFQGPLAFSMFLGAARYDLATPAFGYYLGLGAQWRDVMPGFDLGLDLRYADKVARDKLLPSDPLPEPRPDTFYDITSATLSLSYRW